MKRNCQFCSFFCFPFSHFHIIQQKIEQYLLRQSDFQFFSRESQMPLKKQPNIYYFRICQKCIQEQNPHQIGPPNSFTRMYFSKKNRYCSHGAKAFQKSTIDLTLNILILPKQLGWSWLSKNDRIKFWHLIRNVNYPQYLILFQQIMTQMDLQKIFFTVLTLSLFTNSLFVVCNLIIWKINSTFHQAMYLSFHFQLQVLKLKILIIFLIIFFVPKMPFQDFQFQYLNQRKKEFEFKIKH